MYIYIYIYICMYVCMYVYMYRKVFTTLVLASTNLVWVHTGYTIACFRQQEGYRRFVQKSITKQCTCAML